jgi:hypothetical protein
LQPAQYYRSTSFREIGSDRFTDGNKAGEQAVDCSGDCGDLRVAWDRVLLKQGRGGLTSSPYFRSSGGSDPGIPGARWFLLWLR